MNSEEYEKLGQIEEQHWFYNGKREIVFHWLNEFGVLRPNALLVDCGAGTGRFVQEALSKCRAVAVDDHAESLAMAKARLGDANVIEGSCLKLPFPDRSVDVVTALDVVEHIPDDQGVIREMRRVLKPGGVMVITVPAFQILWSDWDVALHHQRRYRASTLLPLVRGADLTVEHWNYINVAAFPAILLIRKMRALWPKRSGSAPGLRAEEKLPGPFLNRLLKTLFVLPACQRVIRFPFGVGLILIARRGLN